jgi:hypothetical protein
VALAGITHGVNSMPGAQASPTASRSTAFSFQLAVVRIDRSGIAELRLFLRLCLITRNVPNPLAVMSSESFSVREEGAEGARKAQRAQRVIGQHTSRRGMAPPSAVPL